MINTWPGWECVGLLGEGSFGKVYEIQKKEFGTTYKAALKVITIPPAQSDIKAAYAEGMDKQSVTYYFQSVVEDIVEEFALMSQLKGNSNIVSYEDHMVTPHEGEIGWDILIRMELLTALPEYASRHPLDEAEVARLGIHMTRALQLCRRKGILHRDIKPENIFVSENGDYKLGDFGVARAAEKTASQMSRKGTYIYMAPEVYKGEEYGFAADLYSLGLVLYRYLNDYRLPFMPPYPEQIRYTDHERALKARMSGEEIPAPSHGSPALKAVIQRACSFDPARRYASPEEFEQALKEAAAEPKRKEPETSASWKDDSWEDADEFDRTVSAFDSYRSKAAGNGAAKEADPQPKAKAPAAEPKGKEEEPSASWKDDSWEDEDEFDRTVSAFDPYGSRGYAADQGHMKDEENPADNGHAADKKEAAASRSGKEPLIVKILCIFICGILVLTSIFVLIIIPAPMSLFSVAVYIGLIVLIQKIRKKRWGGGR